MIRFTIEGVDYVVELPAGYERSSNRIGFKDERPGIRATNMHGKERWFPGRQSKYIKA